MGVYRSVLAWYDFLLNPGFARLPQLGLAHDALDFALCDGMFGDRQVHSRVLKVGLKQADFAGHGPERWPRQWQCHAICTREATIDTWSSPESGESTGKGSSCSYTPWN